MRGRWIHYDWEALERIEHWDGGELAYVDLVHRTPFTSSHNEVFLYPDRHEICTGYLGVRWIGAGTYHYGGSGCLKMPISELRRIAEMMLKVQSFDDYMKIVEIVKGIPITRHWHA